MLCTCITLGSALTLSAAEQRVAAPDGQLAIIVSDIGGLNYRVVVNNRAGLKGEKFWLLDFRRDG